VADVEERLLKYGHCNSRSWPRFHLRVPGRATPVLDLFHGAEENEQVVSVSWRRALRLR